MATRNIKYMVIFEANKPMLSDPNKIYPGRCCAFRLSEVQHVDRRTAAGGAAADEARRPSAIRTTTIGKAMTPTTGMTETKTTRRTGRGAAAGGRVVGGNRSIAAHHRYTGRNSLNLISLIRN